MTALVPALQAIVRDELAGVHTIELGIVSATYTNEGGSGDTNLAVDARLRGSALELQHVPVAVGRLGLSLIPRVGDLCVLAFVGGDLNGAVVVGFLYDEQPWRGRTLLIIADGARKDWLQLATPRFVRIEPLEDVQLTRAGKAALTLHTAWGYGFRPRVGLP